MQIMQAPGGDISFLSIIFLLAIKEQPRFSLAALLTICDYLHNNRFTQLV